MIRGTCRPRGHHRTAVKVPRPCRGGDSRTALVDRSKILPICAGSLLVLHLRGKWRRVPLAGIRRFLRCRTRLDATVSAVIADIVDGRVVHDHCFVVNVRHVRDANVGDAAVVVEASPAPFAADEAYSAVAVTVVDATIEADVRPPIACVPHVKTATPSPIARRPEHPDWSHHPCARHPVIAVVIVPAPISGRPDVAGAGANWLRVHGQSERPDAHRYPHGDLPERRSR